jgi:DNA-binding winged helix-turn-helix (wHTH) protein/tetratricopeptide (TPR) repeat protein
MLGSCEYDEVSRELRVDDRTIALGPAHLKLLSMLLRGGGAILSREELVESAWGGGVLPESAALAAAIRQLREALRGSGASVITVQDRGYRLACVPPGEAEHDVLERLQDKAVDDLLQVSDEELLEEAGRDGEDVQAAVASFRSCIAESMAARRRVVRALPQSSVSLDLRAQTRGSRGPHGCAPRDRTSVAAPAYVYAFGKVALDEGRRELRVDGLPVSIDPLPLKVLSELLRAGGTILTREQLLERVWGDMGRRLQAAAVTTAVARLRRALGEDADHIWTVPGKGYSFNFSASGAVRRSMAEHGSDAPWPDARRTHVTREAVPEARPPDQVCMADGVEDVPARAGAARLPRAGTESLRYRWWALAVLAVLSLAVAVPRNREKEWSPTTPVQGSHDSILDAALEGRFVGDPRTRAALLVSAGEAHLGRSELAQAEAAQREAIRLLDRTISPGDPAALAARYHFVRTLDMLNRYAEAGSVLAEADRAGQGLLQVPSELAMTALWVHAGHELMQFRPDNALPLYEQVERMRTQVAPADLVWRFRALGSLAWCKVRLNRMQEAKELLEGLMGAEHPVEAVGLIDWARAHLGYALALSGLGRQAQAEAEALNVVSQSQHVAGVDAYLTGLAWDHFASILWASGQFQTALGAERRAHAILKVRLGSQGMATLQARGKLAALEYLAGALEPALQHLSAAHTDMTTRLGADAPFTQLVSFYQAAALSENGSAMQAALLVAPLDPKKLAAAEAGTHWQSRLNALKGDIWIRTGRIAEGTQLLQDAVADLQQGGAEEWIWRRLKRELPPAS